MSDQPSLFLESDIQGRFENRPNAEPYQGHAPSQGHSETSREAGAQIEPSAGTLRAAVLDYLRSRPGGATDEQIQDGLAMPQNTERPRRRELQLKGLILDSGRKQDTKSGRAAVVWVTRENFEPARSSVPPRGANCARSGRLD